MEPEKILGEMPMPDAEKWHAYGFTLQQETPNRLEDAAKFLAGMISISLTLTIPNLDRLLKMFSQTFWIKLGFGLWLISLAVAFFVIYPRKYQFHSQSAEQIKAVHQRLWRYKRTLFIIAVITYFIPFLIFGIIFILMV
jgi:hypothetical protein